MTTPPRVTWLAETLDALPDEDSWIDPLLAQRLAAMQFAKRRSETTLARWTVKHAIAMTLGMSTSPADLRRVVVHNAVDGAPEAHVDGVPLSGVIAMTDRADVAVAMVIDGAPRIGCDLELVEPRSRAFVRDYFTAAEQLEVAASPDPDVTANLIWSAKESALKVLRTGLRRDTRTVEVTLGRDDGGSWHPMHVTVDDGRAFPGWWLRSGPFLLTCAAEVPTEPPRTLIEPHGLTGASPSHRWMRQPRTPSIER